MEMKAEDPITTLKTTGNIKQAMEQKTAINDNLNIDEQRAHSS